MLRSAFLRLRRSEAAAFVFAREQIDCEGCFAVCQQVPAGAVKLVAVDAGDADALPTQTDRFPCDALRSPGEHQMEAYEEKEILCGEWAYFDDGLH